MIRTLNEAGYILARNYKAIEVNTGTLYKIEGVSILKGRYGWYRTVTIVNTNTSGTQTRHVDDCQDMIFGNIRCVRAKMWETIKDTEVKPVAYIPHSSKTGMPVKCKDFKLSDDIRVSSVYVWFNPKSESGISKIIKNIIGN